MWVRFRHRSLAEDRVTRQLKTDTRSAAFGPIDGHRIMAVTICHSMPFSPVNITADAVSIRVELLL